MNIPRDLLANAYLAESGEAAWSAEEAVKVVHWALTHEIAVLGVEVWLPTHPGPTIPTPFIYNMDTKFRDHETWTSYVCRANERAAHFILGFQWDVDDARHKDETPYFNLALGSSDVLMSN